MIYVDKPYFRESLWMEFLLYAHKYVNTGYKLYTGIPALVMNAHDQLYAKMLDKMIKTVFVTTLAIAKLKKTERCY